MERLIITWLLVIALGLCGGLRGQQESVKEKVAVVNVEVPVRVFLDGEPVAGLGKEDFQLFEGKEKQVINGFYVRRKKLAVQNVDIHAETDAKTAPGRYFVLVFRIIEYNEQLKKGIDYIFDNILRDSDRLLIMANDRTLELNKDIWQVKRHELVNQIVNEEAVKARQNLETYFLSVLNDLDQTKLGMLMERDASFYPPRIIDFLEKYLQTWEEFKKKYLIPDLDKFYNFAHHLEKIRGEKWVFSFYQIEMFPHMKISGEIRRRIEETIEQLLGDRPEDNTHGRIIAQLMERINRELNMASEFPIDEVGKMLVRVDTTYHSFIIGVERTALSEDLEYKKVASDIQNSLQQIARQSGGQVVFSGNIGSALHAVVEREDVHYVLTYEPIHPAKKGKVRVVLANPKYRLYYDDKIRADYIGDYLKKKRAQDPTLQVNRLQWSESKLQLEIVDFKMAETAKGMRGNLNVTVRIRDEQNRQLFDQNRTFLAREGHVSVAIDFSFLKAGKYMFLVDVRDLLSEKTAMDILQVTVD